MQLSPRQIHLDFHTSPDIPGIASDFDPAAFAKTALEADISSMTVFARCHHGMLYYPSRHFSERVHPQLENRNLLVEQVDALHAVGIRAPVYITVQWDYYTANAHPEWLVRKPGGTHEGDAFTKPGFYQSLCVGSAYRDFLFEQTKEVIQLLGEKLDGLFFDIVGIRPCLCATCRAVMRAENVDMTDEMAVRAFASRTLDAFKADMSALVRSLITREDCTIFYNAGHIGPCTRTSRDAYTHFELESLPSGGWGYLHFPVTARYARTLNLDCMGMTGKFHTSWGDFHSLKNPAALEFEAFRMLSFGFACSIGDQLEPYGRLNPATYRLIGKVYTPFKAYEAYARPSAPIVEAAVLTPEAPLFEHQIPDSILGAAQLLEELALQFDIVDADAKLDKYRLVIVPDDMPGTEALTAKLNAYVAGGGRILACHHGGQDPKTGAYPDCYQALYGGETELYPNFILPQGALSEGLEPDTEYVIYEQGADITPAAGAEVLLKACAPYFARTGAHFCSHQYTPSAHGEAVPAALGNGSVLLFSHPLFTQYRLNAPQWVKVLVSNALRLLLGDLLVSHDGPSTLSVQLLSQPEQGRVCAHILTYIPVRKSATIDIIEERSQARNVTFTFNLDKPIRAAKLIPGDTVLPVNGQSVTVPCVDGYGTLVLEV